ncbi:DUF5680 domain-containing protein [Paenibacillus sp. HW567]|uniref:DUF5680 domain-containing protein n=1 Tax=Paenibacillus sp. HW567 TaxID=1034769 RepID=UPI0003736CAA|nr:DUF5680 domain-containing protein [Paenibacillus sp. HW567]
MEIEKKPLVEFLLKAKNATYAAQGDEASVPPLLEGYRQLEYVEGDYFYRDVYVGMAYFAGQETIYFHGQPIWSMTYGGGTLKELSLDEVKDTYAFLRQAMRRVAEDHPYRGPHTFSAGVYQYFDVNEGDMERFSGKEKILRQGTEIYSLQYCGGLIC